MNRGLNFLLTALVLVAWTPAQSHPAHPHGATELLYLPFGLDMTAADPRVKPGDDFFQFCNGSWLDRTNIAPDKPYMTEAQAVRDRVEVQLRALIEEAAAAAKRQPDSLQGKVGAFYQAFMSANKREAAGARPIADDLAAIRRSRSRDQIALVMGQVPFGFDQAFFQIGIDADLKDISHYVVYLLQAGLSMPDRDYYLKPEFAEEKRKFQLHVEKMLHLIGWQSPRRNADAIAALETRIAQVSWTKEQQRDVVKTYNAFTVPELESFAPGFNWRLFLKDAKLADKERLVIAEKTAFPQIAKIFADTPLETLQAWLAFGVADTAAPYLTHAFSDEYFDFHKKVLLGIEKRPDRWKEGVRAVAGGDCLADPTSCFGSLDWAVGELYSAKHFPAETKTRMQSLVANVIRAYRHRIEHLDWMAETTREEALHKLDTYVVKVGYPDQPRDYSGLVVRGDDVVGNVRRAAAAEWDFQVRRSRGPVDKSAWTMTPQTFDAYNGSLRDIVFPAAILQPPYFDPAADDAVNYGATGATIGHELTHGFDDQGRMLDAKGEIRDRWTAADDQAFKARAAVLGGQFATYEPVAGLHINPDLTMGENIADLGGIVVALDAYHDSLHGSAAPVIEGLTGDQRFFRSFAQSWRGKAREDYIRNLTVSDPHSWRRFRVNGIVRNVEGWYEAFGVTAPQALYVAPEARARSCQPKEETCDDRLCTVWNQRLEARCGVL